MEVPGMCQRVSAALRHVEPVIVLEQLGNTLFETALQMVVKDRSDNASSTEAEQQKAMTDFYMTYNLIIRFVPILPSLLLARLSDRGWRRAPVVVPLSGYLLSRLLLLLVVLLRLPLEVMYAAAALFGLTGGFSALWPGVMTLVSLRSSAAERSKVMMRVELLYGGAGLVASLVSGHLFQLYTSSLGNGTILLIVSTLLHLLSLCFAAFLLQVKYVIQEPEENRCLLSPTSHNAPVVEGPARINKLNVALLFAAAFLYDLAVGGAISLLGPFVLKAPLSWTAMQLGYGNAAGCGIFFTSFVGAVVFRRFASDETIILIGMVSFAFGIYLMTFTTTTAMFYIARSFNLFALIPMPTIRSLLSQHVPASSWGTVLTFLQMTLKIAGIIYIPVFTSVYQKSLEWLPGMVFLLSSIITVCAMIPISILGCRTAKGKHYKSIQEDPGSLNQ
ncbi:hypothetical protein OJAV_G00118250 [Oryzias javanicus]|uniref:Major facilitator superfamily (MFS) profile domain-containing protein n=1 Tax=Oryzias javanicus TaxID=123683 RepID=A0A437CS56_ORYJA|nr:hypothetical protein OJAV_G00118250 [Oryzias javanicus]